MYGPLNWPITALVLTKRYNKFCYWDNADSNLSFLPDLLALLLALSGDETLFSSNRDSTKSHTEIHEQLTNRWTQIGRINKYSAWNSDFSHFLNLSKTRTKSRSLSSVEHCHFTPPDFLNSPIFLKQLSFPWRLEKYRVCTVLFYH